MRNHSEKNFCEGTLSQGCVPGRCLALCCIISGEASYCEELGEEGMVWSFCFKGKTVKCLCLSVLVQCNLLGSRCVCPTFTYE